MPEPVSLLRGAFTTLLITSAAWCDVAEAPESPWTQWLGEQNYDEYRHKIAKRVFDVDRYGLTVGVFAANSLKLQPSKNPTVVLDVEQRALTHVRVFQPEKGKRYVVCHLHLKKGQLGWRHYTLDVRITGGPLKGAIVHLRDGQCQESIVDPCYAVYPIPAGLDLGEGRLEYEVVAVDRK